MLFFIVSAMVSPSASVGVCSEARARVADLVRSQDKLSVATPNFKQSLHINHHALDV